MRAPKCELNCAPFALFFSTDHDGYHVLELREMEIKFSPMLIFSGNGLSLVLIVIKKINSFRHVK
jgi:hypothetical protein